jgi:putative intracellular protease/amidase
MRVSELIERLAEIQENQGDIEVLGAFQPRYPLTASIQAVTTVVIPEADKATVYIALGGSEEYGDSFMWNDDEITVCAECESDDCDCDETETASV